MPETNPLTCLPNGRFIEPCLPPLLVNSLSPPVEHALSEPALRSLHLRGVGGQAAEHVDHVQVKAVAMERPALRIDDDAAYGKPERPVRPFEVF